MTKIPLLSSVGKLNTWCCTDIKYISLCVCVLWFHGASNILSCCGRTVWVPATLKLISPMFLVTALVDWWCGGCVDPEINSRWIVIVHTVWCMIDLSCDIESRTFSVVTWVLTCKVCTVGGAAVMAGCTGFRVNQYSAISSCPYPQLLLSAVIWLLCLDGGHPET